MQTYKSKELKTVLGALGAPKYGSKSTMTTRIKGIVCDGKPARKVKKTTASAAKPKTAKPKSASKPKTPTPAKPKTPTPAKPKSPAKLYLKATYQQKEDVKALGARWSATKKSWWVKKTPENVTKFAKWL